MNFQSFKTSLVICVGLLIALGSASTAIADVFHYSNILIGERAVGLGGAFAGLSDDASGLYYNPAGLAFSAASDVSGSANTFVKKKLNYKRIIGDEEFTEDAQAFLPTFFGGTQKFDWAWNGFSMGFAVYSTDNELKDQDDLMTDATADIKAYHRTLTTRNSTLYISVGGAKMIGSRASVGLALNFVNIDETSQQYQDSVIRTGLRPKDTTNGDIYLTYTENFYTHLISRGIEPVMGAQFSLLDSLSIGVAARKAFFFEDTLSGKIDTSSYYRFLSNNKIVTQDDVIEADQAALAKASGVVVRATSTENTTGGPKQTFSTDNALGGLPAQFRAGLAWFPTNRFLLTFDTNIFLAEDSGESAFRREQVINFHLGTEYYLVPSIFMRAGLFTNLDARSADVETSPTGEHIDFYGGSLFFGLAQENNQLSIGSVYQMAKGEAIKVAGGAPTEVDGYIVSVLFSASHHF